MSKLTETFRSRLLAAFADRGDQAEFIRKAGIAPNTFHHWRRAERSPSLDQVERVAEALETSPIDLLFPGELPKAPPPSDPQIVAGFLGLFAEIAMSEPAREAFAGALMEALEIARSARS